ncbi:MAG: ATP-binding protein [Acidobacteria bacterium]|nr:ATP-binding protein [Acidobacteriota bacterium]
MPDMLQRREIAHLEAWATRRPRKPIVIRGARQVGKSTLVREFARAAGLSLVAVDFERNPELREAFTGRDPARVLALLRLLTGQTAAAGTHLLFLDEIQAAPEALAALRYFHEEMPELHVLAAGSLLEFALAETRFPMPVGRVEYMHLGPMHFEDFAIATGEADLAGFLRGFPLHSVSRNALPGALHRKCLDLLRRYWVVGGLPEAVAAFVRASRVAVDFEAVARVLQSIVATYRDDFGKYGRSRDGIRRVFDRLPHLVARKFKYVEVSRDHRAADIGAALEHLCMARVACKVFRTAANGVPLAAEINERFFKCLHVDVGLLCAALGLDLLDLERPGDPTLVNRGAVAEQFVGQHLLYSEAPYRTPALHYWARETRNAAAEIDYVIAAGRRVVPVEVKAGATGSLRSLHQFVREKSAGLAVRFNADPPSLSAESSTLPDGTTVRYDLLSLPLYLVGQTRRLIGETAVERSS